MTKTPKPKYSSKPSPHSRASRRASSPALEGNLDKSLRTLPRPSTSSTSHNILAPRAGAGVAKPNAARKKGGKVLKRKQKVRLEQGKERAEAVIGKLERKVERAKRTREGRRGRNADWDELNEKIAGRKKSKRGTIADQSHEDGTWEDENENMEAMNTDRKAANTAVSAIEGAAGMGTEITATVDAGGGSGGAAEVEDEIS